MEVVKRKDKKNPIKVVLTDGTEIIVPKQSKFKTNWLRKHGCPFVCQWEVLQFLGIKGQSIKELWQWALKHTVKYMGASLWIRGVLAELTHFTKGKGTVKYFAPKTIKAKNMQKYLEAGCMIIITRRKPSIHYYVVFMDAGVVYTLNYKGSGRVDKKSVKFLVSTKCNNKNYGGMLVISRPKGSVNQAKGKEPVKKVVKSAKKSNETIANEVINGKWGSGSERKSRLEKAGYNYKVIQNIVNKKVR